MIWANETIVHSDLDSYINSNQESWIYEVMRIQDGCPIFLEEHLDRLEAGISILSSPISFDRGKYRNAVFEVIENNRMDIGNIRIQINHQQTTAFIGEIPHHYPSNEQTELGVNIGILDKERSTPNIKSWNPDVRLSADDLIRKTGVYEVLLVNESKQITEGSRSNFFGIVGDQVITPPIHQVLPGITRKVINDLCTKLGVIYHEREILEEQLDDFDALFISGTSPEILPIKRVNNLTFNPKHHLIRELRTAYHMAVKQNIMTNKIYNFDHLPKREDTNCVKWDLRERYFGKQDILPLWVADMDFETPDFILNRIKERLDHPVLGYTFRPEKFNTAFIDWALKKYNWKVMPEWMSFSPGVVSAVTLAVQGFTEPDDEIIVQPPVYFPFFTCIEGLNRKLIHNQLKEADGRLTMDYDNLESIITSKTKMIIISNPHNPGGTVWTETELERLGEICAKHNLFVVSDEIHSDLVFEPHKHVPFAKMVPQEKVKSISCMAASKTFNLAGLSTSLVIIPDEEVKKEFERIMNVSHINMGNIFGGIATQAAYAEGENWLDQLMAYLKGNRDYLTNFIEENLSPLRILIPEATYLAWIDFSELGMKQDKLNHWLVNEAKVGLNSGTMFGPGGEGFVRINFACPRSLLIKALNQIEQAMKSL